jgi:hypothetical protein
MPDTYLPPAVPALSVETGDGFIVVSRKLTTVLPPYRYQYSYDHFEKLEGEHGADQFYRDLKNGEIAGWEPVSIVPCRDGVPLGAKVMP